MALHKDKIIANTLVVVGLLDREPYLGEEYSFIGGFKVDPNHGFQFHLIILNARMWHPLVA